MPQVVADLMVPGEQSIAAYATHRDSAIFTTKHLIIREAQWLRGKKVEAYSSINMLSSENVGCMLDFTGDLELWTHVGKIKISVAGGCAAVEYVDCFVCSGGRSVMHELKSVDVNLQVC